MTIHIVTGPPCGGKSTLVTERRAAGDVVIDFDALAVAFGSDTPHASAGEVRTVTVVARKAAIERVLTGIKSDSWIIHSWPTSDQIERYKGAGAEIIEVDPGLEVALERAATDNRPDGTEHAIRAWYAQREETTTMPEQKARRRIKSFAMPSTGFKAVGQLDPTTNTALLPGEFIALAAVFGNIDSYNERIKPGAFTRTLAEWAAKGDPIPVIWYHSWTDAFAHIGEVLWIQETEQGLLYKGRLDIDDNALAAQVYRLMKGRRVTQQSFGFDVIEAGEVVEDADHIYEIRDVDLFEVGPCLVGVNQETELVDIKSISGDGLTPPPEQTGQESNPAASSDSSSVTPGSIPDPQPASKGLSPASVQLIIGQFEIEE
jgi:HK97 family phage prohead protease